MLTLFIETSTEKGLIALAKGAHLLHFLRLESGYREAHLLLPLIERELREKGVSPQDLERIAVGSGPGSYTGIRIAVMTAKCFAFALGIPLAGVSSLMGFIPTQDGTFAALFDAKIGGAYVVLGQKRADKVIYRSAPSLYSLPELIAALAEVNTIVTPHRAPLQRRLKEMAVDLERWKWEEGAPDVPHLVTLADEAFREGRFSTECALDILYLRKAQAEIEASR